ncbi:MAG: signal peptidase I [bacterium]
MVGYFEKRRILKLGREWLHHARLCRHLREDIAGQDALNRLDKAEADLKKAVAKRDASIIEAHCESVHKAISVVMPPKSFPGLRENLEVIVVAIAVAMAFRTFFLQPFKIPTGSMQPTLYGIHFEPASGKGIFDMGPLWMARWLVFGETYVDYKAKTAGVVRGPYSFKSTDEGKVACYDIGGLAHYIPEALPKTTLLSQANLMLTVKPGDEVVTGQVIARGIKITGDHLFVNRVRWNFMKPTRGEVMVFRTDGIPIPRLSERTHYIKRMCGLPGESISIHEPELIVNGKPVAEPYPIRRIEDRVSGYAGYYCPGDPEALYIRSSNDVVTLGPNKYLALGDNTHNSLDGRYWGPVPAANLVGPAMVVYWPISKRWGWIQ